MTGAARPIDAARVLRRGTFIVGIGLEIYLDRSIELRLMRFRPSDAIQLCPYVVAASGNIIEIGILGCGVWCAEVQ